MYKIEDFSKYRKELYNVAKNLTRSRFLDKNTIKSFYRKEIVDEILQNSFLIYHNRLNNNTIDNEFNTKWKENNLKSKNNFYFLLTIGLHFPFSETLESSTKQFESIPDPDLKRYYYLVRSTTRSLFEFVEKIK